MGTELDHALPPKICFAIPNGTESEGFDTLRAVARQSVEQGLFRTPCSTPSIPSTGNAVTPVPPLLGDKVSYVISGIFVSLRAVGLLGVASRKIAASEDVYSRGNGFTMNWANAFRVNTEMVAMNVTGWNRGNKDLIEKAVSNTRFVVPEDSGVSRPCQLTSPFPTWGSLVRALGRNLNFRENSSEKFPINYHSIDFGHMNTILTQKSLFCNDFGVT